MSSVTSTNEVRLKPDTTEVRPKPDAASKSGVRLKPDSTSDQGFHPWQFFVLLSLAVATVAVLIARQPTPEHLVLISLAIGAAGFTGYAAYRTLAPLVRPDGGRVGEPLGRRTRASLEREKTLTLRAIKELEFDRAMGKVAQQDFDEMTSRLRARALGIMEQLQEGALGAQVLRVLKVLRVLRVPRVLRVFRSSGACADAVWRTMPTRGSASAAV